MDRPLRKAVFLDRDGTLMEEVNYCRRPEDVQVFPDAIDSLRRLHAAGFLCVIITNQAGIGRGYFSENDYHAVHAELLHQLAAETIDGTYFCPDAPYAATDRRKPAPGMVLEAARDFGIDLSASYFVGDKTSDIECGARAGCRTILVETGYGAKESATPDCRVPNLTAAVDAIL